METKFNHDVPIQEMKRMYAGQSAGMDSIKVTMRTMFSAAGFILALLGALQVFTTKVDPSWQSVYSVILGVIFVLYIVFILICISGMLPIYWYPPLDDDWDTMTTTFQNLDKDQEDAIYLALILRAIENNAPTVNKYVSRLRISLFLFPLIVLLVLSLAFIPRV